MISAKCVDGPFAGRILPIEDHWYDVTIALPRQFNPSDQLSIDKYVPPSHAVYKITGDYDTEGNLILTYDHTVNP
jgi:hypothetical protein